MPFLGIIAGVLVLWGLGVSHLLAHTGSSVPLLNSIELCILTAALTQVRRQWPRRHVIGLSTAMCVQLAAFMALYALWTGSLWLLSLRMTTLNLVTAAVLPWGVVAQGVVMATSTTGTVTYVSPIAESIYGYAPAEIVNRPFTDFVPAEDVPRLMQGFAAVLSGTPDLRDHRIVTKAGDIRWVRNSAREVTEGRGISLRGVLTDVTERRRIEHELRTLTDELDMRVIDRTRQRSEALDQLRLQGAALEAAPDAAACSRQRFSSA